jgi:hypothetical protein
MDDMAGMHQIKGAMALDNLFVLPPQCPKQCCGPVKGKDF